MLFLSNYFLDFADLSDVFDRVEVNGRTKTESRNQMENPSTQFSSLFKESGSTFTSDVFSGKAKF